jgi:hypothetical protein
MNILIPYKIYERLTSIVEIQFYEYNEKDKTKLNKRLIELWYFIYNRQKDDETIDTLKGFTNIKFIKFEKFRININKYRFTSQILLNLLEENDLIEINHKYSKTNFSKGYKIKTIESTNYAEVEIDFDIIFNNFKTKKYWLRKYPSLKKQIKEAYEVKVDLGDYITWLKSNLNTNLKPIIKNGILQKRVLTEERIYNYINTALVVNYGNLWFKVSGEGRFYNTLTNLSYTSIDFLKLKRRNIVEIDVKNCQPSILSLLIENDKYKKDVEAGVFYNRMADELGKTRNEFKVLSYKYIFFSKRQLKSGPIFEALEKLYPDFIEEMNKLRKIKNVSNELQKIESSIFVDIISHLDYKMMLRHDAVFVYEEDFEYVKRIVVSEFKKKGVNVKIK